MKELQGKWNYQSFCSFAADVDRTKQPPDVKRPARIAGPWTPPSVMEFTTDEFGKVTGSANLGPIEFKIRGLSNPPNKDISDGIQLVVTVDAAIAQVVTGIKKDAVYNLQGSFLANSDHIVGTVVCISNDLGFQPDGTAGPFVLYPVAA